MAKTTEISPCLTKFIKAIVENADVSLASIVLKGCLRKAHVDEISQLNITKEVYGVSIYMRTNTGHETTAKISDVNGKYKEIKNVLKDFVNKYNGQFIT